MSECEVRKGQDNVVSTRKKVQRNAEFKVFKDTTCIQHKELYSVKQNQLNLQRYRIGRDFCNALQVDHAYY